MIYVIDGKEEYFIKEKINEIIKGKNAEIVKFDGSDKNFSIDEMLEACESNSLFSNETVVLVNQPYFLNKRIEDKELERLYRYIDNPIYETDLIFYTYEDNFNSKLKAYKTVLGNAQHIKLDGLDYKNFNNYVKERIKQENININNDALNLLNTICKRDATLLNQNLEILSLYPEKITTQVINKLCVASDENEAFDLLNALTSKDVSKTISLSRKLMQSNDSIYSVIGLIANQLRYLYNLAYLQSIGKKKSEILDITNSNEYRLNLSLDVLKNLSMNQIIELLANLSDLDYKCKSDSSLSEENRFELFILNLLKKETYASN